MRSFTSVLKRGLLIVIAVLAVACTSDGEEPVADTEPVTSARPR